jgi:hypothetical protein
MTRARSIVPFALTCLALSGPAGAAPASGAAPRESLRVERAAGEIHIDGDLSEAAWTAARPIENWHQISPGMKGEPKVRTVARLAFDDRALYVALEMDDPKPASIRAPLTDRDNALSSSDYAGIILDGPNDGKTAQEFLANPRGIQYDAIWSDIAGEDLAPSFFWQSAAKIGEHGWTLEMRIPFSSIRYVPGANPVWGITLFRNWPRERRYQFATALQPTDCFICNENQLTGLEGLPRGGSWAFAPYGVARRTETPRGGELGQPLEAGDVKGDGGFDFKWNPSARHTIDVTVNPDFSQVESDVAQITTNQRFALFFPEKRPFFLEQIDLFSTPQQAIYTRSITEPRGGLRATGRFGSNVYTLLVVDDRGGGSVVIPGPTSSSTAFQDFESKEVVGRLRHDLGASYVSLLASGREIDGGGSNHVYGPDFQWQPNAENVVVGQLLWSESDTPERTDLADEWDGRQLSGHAGLLSYAGSGGSWDWSLEGRDVSEGFRADNGFVPRVGYRQGTGELGRSFGIGQSFFTGARLFANSQYAEGEDSELLTRIVSGGAIFGGRRATTMRFVVKSEDERVGGVVLSQNQGRWALHAAPSGLLASLDFSVYAGSAIDFENVREGDGAGAALEAILRSRKHLEVRINAERNQLDVDLPDGRSGRVFTADLARIRATWTFTPRLFLRLISQQVETRRDPALYVDTVTEKDSELQSSVLFGYKLDWQSVVYLGYGDSRTFLAESGQREPSSREIFFKVSYAFHR